MTTILIVDDSRFQRTFVRRILDPEGYTILEAGNGREALDVLSESTPDCILTDLIMPDMRGLALLEALQRRGSTIPALVLTADIQEAVKEQCLQLGALDVLHKPIKPQVLIERLARVAPPGGEGM